MIEETLTRQQLEEMGTSPSMRRQMFKRGAGLLCISPIFCPEVRRDDKVFQKIALLILAQLRTVYGNEPHAEEALCRLVGMLISKLHKPPMQHDVRP